MRFVVPTHSLGQRVFPCFCSLACRDLQRAPKEKHEVSVQEVENGSEKFAVKPPPPVQSRGLRRSPGGARPSSDCLGKSWVTRPGNGAKSCPPGGDGQQDVIGAKVCSSESRAQNQRKRPQITFKNCTDASHHLQHFNNHFRVQRALAARVSRGKTPQKPTRTRAIFVAKICEFFARNAPHAQKFGATLP